MHSSKRASSSSASDSALRKSSLNHDSSRYMLPPFQQRALNDVESSHTAEGNEQLSSAAIFTDRDTRLVSLSRLLVLFVLVASMAGTATAVYLFTRHVELELFRRAFTSDSNDVIESVGETLYTSLGAVDAYLVSLISLARSTNQTWPYVSVPDASVRLAKLRSLSKAVAVQQAHFVAGPQKQTWENYTAHHNQWATQALRVQKSDKNYRGTVHESFVHKSTIRSYKGESTGDGPFLPTWHSSPFVPDVSPYNIDGMQYSNVVQMLPELLDDKHVVICKSNNIVNSSNPVSVLEVNSSHQYWRSFLHPSEDPTEPLSWFLFPIVDDVADHISYEHDATRLSKAERKVVGLFSMFVFFRDLIQSILPEETKGVIVVFSNACGQVFTYEVNGRSTEYRGPLDDHDPTFDKMGVSIGFDQLVNKSTTGEQYTGLPLGGDLCPYTLTIYPSAKRQAQFTSQRPALLTVCAVLIFIFTSAVFMLYDTCVERRQRKILYAAVESRANVSILERMVSDRTKSLEETNRRLEEANRRLEEANRRVTKAYEAQLEHFACMSHEIRTPLNCIIGLSSLLLDTELQPMQEESMRMIVTSGDLLLTVVNDVLDFAKLESGNVDIVPIRSNLQHTLNAVVQSMETKASPKELSIRTTLDPLVGEYMYIDDRRLQQILYNLLGNAVKFSNQGGTIQLSVSLLVGGAAREAALLEEEAESSENDEVFRSETMVVRRRPSHSTEDSNSFTITNLRASKQASSGSGNVIRFKVRDSGKGIERKDFETIFQPFRQASAETERVFGGTGLGLAVTSRLVTTMGGTISVDSQVGEWSEFTVDLPYADSPVDLQHLGTRLADASIMYVDDVPANVDDVVRVVRQLSLDFFCYRTMSDMSASITKLEGKRLNQMYICLVNEKLYNKGMYESLRSTANCVLLSYGPNFTVKESKIHYRSLAHVLPSVLVESFIAAADSVKQSPLTVNGNSALRLAKETLAINNPANMLRILIAEDNKINQKVLLKLLDKLGFKDVDVVEDGKQACDKTLEQEYDIILMDIQMPVMDGIKACVEILGRSADFPQPKIVFITAHVSEKYKFECIQAGGVDFLPKPINIATIEECLRTHSTGMHVAPLAAADTAAPASPVHKEPATDKSIHDESYAPALPVREEFEAPTSPRRDELVAPDPATTLRILVAEDNKINQKVLMRILDRLGYKNVDVVDDGQQACDKELEKEYDLILMDIQMPIMDGIVACRTILQRPSNHAKKPKVVFVTAHALDTYEAECRAAGGVDFIAKPVKMVEMGNCLRRHA